MLVQFTSGLLKEKKNLKTIMDNWAKGKEKVLNIATVPYISCEILLEEIMNYIYEEKRVLYIANDVEGFGQLLSYLRKVQYFNYKCIMDKKESVSSSERLIICTHEKAREDLGDFDLVVYDDVTSFSKYSKLEILDLLSAYYRNNSRIICRSIESIFKKSTCIEIPAKEQGTPIVEPRIITTRIDINREIPAVIYDYINWSIQSKRKVVIFVPNLELGENVYNYLLNFRHNFKNIMVVDREADLQKYSGVFITNHLERLDKQLPGTDYIVYSAEDKSFEYKKLVFICSKSEKTGDGNMGEVIFLSKGITRDMENCRDIIRRFNKIAWKRKLLNI